jgi:hypothetical protein
VNSKTDVNVFFSPITYLLFYTIGLFITQNVGIIGGTLWPDLCLFLGSITLLYAVVFLVVKSRSVKLDKSFLQEYGGKLLKKQKTIFRLSLVFVILILVSPLLFTGVSNFTGNKDSELEKVVYNITKDSTNDTQKLQSILSWFNRTTNQTDNVANIYYRNRANKILLSLNFDISLYVFSEPPYFCVRSWDDSPLWIFNARCGMCGEYSILFMEMAKRANLTVRRVTCAAENHEWDEVIINNTLLIIDPTAVQLPVNTGYQKPDFMMMKVAGEWKTEHANISYVYA